MRSRGFASYSPDPVLLGGLSTRPVGDAAGSGCPNGQLVSVVAPARAEMTGVGQSPRDPYILNRVDGPPSPHSSSGGDAGCAEEAPARGAGRGVNLRRVLRVGSWNILSLSDDQRLPHLSDELSRLRVDIVGLSETRRPGSGEISSRGYTYYWSGTGIGGHLMPI